MTKTKEVARRKSMKIMQEVDMIQLNIDIEDDDSTHNENSSIGIKEDSLTLPLY